MFNCESNDEALKLRPEVQWSLHESKGAPYYLVEDPVANSFYRIGVAEWTFACQFDGKTSQQLAYQRTIEKFGANALPAANAQKLLSWLVNAKLVRNTNTDAGPLPPPPKANPLSSIFFYRLPLLHPDKWLGRISGYFGWCFTLPAILAWVVIFVWGLTSIGSDWDRFSESASSYFAPSTWLFLLAIWLVLKVIHEAAHGLACKYYGGDVGASGLIFILFSPIAYVDVTSSWRLRSKWHRIAISSAGMYVELFIAAIAAIIWSRTNSPSVAYMCHAIVTTAGVGSLLFNANPLMRFDAYYILTDILEIQNLYNESRQNARSLARKHFFGLETSIRPRSNGEQWIITIYGVASAFWRVLISVSLTIGAAKIFHGAGLVLALLAGVLWFAIPIYKTLAFMVVGNEQEKPAPAKMLRVGVMLILLLFAAWFLPLPGGVRAPAVVDYEPSHEVRSGSPGFVEKILVESGDYVTTGDLLAKLKNDDLVAELLTVTAEAKQSLIQSRILRNDGETPAYQAEMKKYQALVEQRRELKRQVSNLELRAPADGMIITRRPESWLGKYVDAGTALLTLASEDAKEILVSVPEYHVKAFVGSIGRQPAVLLEGQFRALRSATLSSVEPSATDILRHPALGANNGGPLPVQPANSPDEADNSGFKLVAPRFEAHVSLPAAMACQLHAGQLADVRLTAQDETLGKKFRRFATQWFSKKWTAGG